MPSRRRSPSSGQVGRQRQLVYLGGRAPFGPGNGLLVDLEKVFPIDSINVITYYDGSRYYQFTVEASVDGKDWKKVADWSDNEIPATAKGYPTTFDRTDARYVRINMLKNSANEYMHIVEVIVNQAK